MKRKLLVLAISFVMVFTMMPMMSNVYAADEEITSVTDFVLPTPSFCKTVAQYGSALEAPASAKYKVSFQETYFYDKSSPVTLPDNASFIPGVTYKVRVIFKAKPGYTFAANCNWGNTAPTASNAPNLREFTIVAKDHAWGWITLMNKGIKYQQCNTCGKTQFMSDPIPISHKCNVIMVPETNSTCAEHGYKAHYGCTGCPMVYSDPEGRNQVSKDIYKKDLLAHSYQWVVDKEPTETESGCKHKECTVCKTKANVDTSILPLNKQIKKIDFDINPVVAGETPQQVFQVPEGANYTVKLNSWNLNISPSFTELSATDEFQEGKAYILRLYIIPKDGYGFADDCDFGRVNVSYAPNDERCKQITFLAAPREVEIDNNVIVSVSGEPCVYDGTKKTPEIVVVDSKGHVLDSRYEYNVKYSNNTNAGEATATVKGIGNYSFSKTVKFNISPAGLKSATINQTTVYYDSMTWEPEVTVVGTDNKTLVKDVDYTVTYSNNRNIGTAKATVKGKGNYSFEKVLTFTIKARDLASTSKVSVSLCGYDDVKVSWNSVSGAGGYYVYYKKSTSKSYTYAGKTTSNSYKLYNFTDGAKYTFRVYPCVKDGNGYHRDGSYKTSASIYTLKKVSSVKAVRSGTKVKVSWSNISGESGYQISRSTKKTGTYIVKTYSTTSGKYYKVSATKGKTYYYKVRAYKTVSGKRIYAPWSKVYKYRR